METKKEIRYIFILSVFTLFAVRIIASFIIPVYDDAFITYRYAENLAAGNSFVYNPGENVLGVTTPLFALIISILSILPLRPETFIPFLNIIFDSIILFLIYNFFRKENRVYEYTFFSFLYVLSPIMARITVGGMEMNLFLLLSLISVFLYLDGRKSESVLLGTLNYLIRPESALLVILLVLFEFFRGKKKTSYLMVLISCSVLLLPFVFMYFYYGSFIPQSVLSKSGETNSSVFHVLKEFLASDFVMILSFPLAVWSIIKYREHDKFYRLLIYWSLSYLLAFVIFRPHVWSWYPFAFHFFVVLSASYVLANLIKKYSGSLFKVKPLFLSFVLSFLSISVWLVLLSGMGVSGVTKNIYKPLEEWSKVEGLKNKTILASDIGAIGYYSGARIFDSEGLVSPEAKKYKDFKSMILDVNADYLFINLMKNNLLMMNLPEMKDKYTAIKRFSKSGKTELAIDPSSVENIWYQDYLVYKKVNNNGISSTYIK